MKKHIALGLALLFVRLADANVIGSDFQIFNPTPSGVDFLTVHSSEVLEKKRFHISFFANFAANSLPYLNQSASGEDFRRRESGFHDLIGGYDMSLAYGLTERFELAMTVPGVFYQDVNSTLLTGQFERNGLTEWRPMLKYRLTQLNSKQGLAVVASMNNNLIDNNIFLGREAGPTYNLEFVADSKFGKNNFAVNFGRRFRTAEGVLLEFVPPLVDAWLWSVAYSRYFPRQKTKLFVEYYNSLPAESSAADFDTQKLTYSELLIGSRYDLNDSSSLAAGVGTEIVRGTATPTWRLFAGYHYTWGQQEKEPVMTREPVIEPAPELTVLEENFGYVEPVPEPVQQMQTEVVESAPASEEPLPPVPEAEEYNAPTERFVLRNVNFKLDSDNFVYGSSKKYLENLALDIKKMPKFEHVVIVGHTDSLGDDIYNLNLSKRRADSIKKFMVTRHKISASKIKTIGKGERFPIADNGNAQGRLQNRRVEFLVYTTDNPYEPTGAPENNSGL